MKNVFKIFGIIALVATIGFSFAACDDGSGDDGGGTKTKTLTSIAVTTPPIKTSYNVGETPLSTTGMVVTATYSDGTKAPVTDYTTSGFDSTTAGTKTITVTYQGKTTSFTVTVSDIPVVGTPTATPAGGTPVTIGTTITLVSPTGGAEIWYTTNGSTPARNSGTRYITPFAITALPTTVKAIAVRDGWTDSGVLEAVYPATPITTANIVIVVPTNSGTPQREVFNLEQERFTSGPVSWSVGSTPFTGATFLGGTAYTATVTLTAKPGFTFTGFDPTQARIGDATATVTNNTGTTITLSRTFRATSTAVVASIAVKTQPTKMEYTHGDLFELTGLVVTLTYDDGITEDVRDDYENNGVTINIQAHIPLERGTNNGHPVIVTYGGNADKTVNTANLIVNAKDVADLTVEGIVAKTYTGSEIPQAVTVKHTVASGSTRTLEYGTTAGDGVDYTLTYDNATNAGTTAKVIIHGHGDYTGTKEEFFTIHKKDVGDSDVTISIPQKTYTGSALTFAFTVTYNSVLEPGTDYEVTEWANHTNVGTDAEVTIQGAGTNYEGTQTKKFEIVAAHITGVDIAITAPATGGTPQTTFAAGTHYGAGTVSWSSGASTFSGSKFLGSTTYTAAVTLTANTGYTFTDLADAEAKINGTAATTVTNNTSTLTLAFIFPATGAKTVSEITIVDEPTMTYNHGDTPDLSGLKVELKYNDGTESDAITYVSFGTNHLSASLESTTSLSASNTTQKVPITITYTLGSVTVTKQTTSSISIAQKNLSGVTVEGMPTDLVYTGSSRTFASTTLTVSYNNNKGTKITLGSTDYTVASTSFTNNTNASTTTTKAGFTVTPGSSGNFTGSKNEEFSIGRATPTFDASKVAAKGTSGTTLADYTFTSTSVAKGVGIEEVQGDFVSVNLSGENVPRQELFPVFRG